MKTLIFTLLLFLFSSLALAETSNSQLACKVSKVLDDGDFENEHDFTFEDYPNVVYERGTPDGKTLIVGAFSFSENDSAQPSVITEESDSRTTIVVAEPDESGQIFSIAVIESQGKLYYYSEENNGTREVAELICE